MMNLLRLLVGFYMKCSLVLRILVGMLLGGVLAWFFPQLAVRFALLGQLFVSALKAIAPVLVFFLVLASIANQSVKQNENARLSPVLFLYLLGTLLAALVAVVLSFAFPVQLLLFNGANAVSPPSGIVEVLTNLVNQIVQNPLQAIMQGNYVGIVAWAAALGFVLRRASEHTKMVFSDISEAITQIVRFVIQLAPIGIFGLVAGTLAQTGFSELVQYSQLLILLLSAMLIVALVVNPLIVFIKKRKNPYPLVLACLRESGVTAFFTRSSAANIPVNMALCERLGLNKDIYSVSIPLGATVNMAGAAITITTMTMAAVHTLGLSVDMPTAVLLCFISALSACGASGVAGGSLLLIPLACALFGIGDEVAMQVVAVGFIVGVVQDSAETALNSSTDVVFSAACDEGEI